MKDYRYYSKNAELKRAVGEVFEVSEWHCMTFVWEKLKLSFTCYNRTHSVFKILLNATLGIFNCFPNNFQLLKVSDSEYEGSSEEENDDEEEEVRWSCWCFIVLIMMICLLPKNVIFSKIILYVDNNIAIRYTRFMLLCLISIFSFRTTRCKSWATPPIPARTRQQPRPRNNNEKVIIAFSGR